MSLGGQKHAVTANVPVCYNTATTITRTTIFNTKFHGPESLNISSNIYYNKNAALLYNGI